MIDDTKPVQRRPVSYLSMHDLRTLGFDIYLQEFPKEKPDGETVTAVRVVKVMKDGKTFPKHMMLEFLKVFGIDIDERVWVTPKKMHRCLSQKEPVYDYRYMGMERSDKVWLTSGRASTEVIMWTSNMVDMSRVVDDMKHGGGDE